MFKPNQLKAKLFSSKSQTLNQLQLQVPNQKSMSSPKPIPNNPIISKLMLIPSLQFINQFQIIISNNINE